MKLFDAGQHATGFIAVGQEATGFFALGQNATGVIAIGQLARGVIAVGQLSFGLIGWGQLGAGVFHAVGMIGVGGRGFGPVLRLVPSIGRPREMPPSTTLAAVEGGEAGWIDVDLAGGGPDTTGPAGSNPLGLYQGRVRLPIKLDRRLQKKGLEVAAEGPRRVLAYTRRIGPVLVCERIAFEPPRPFQKKGFWVLATLQLVGLLALGTAYAGVVGRNLVAGLDKVFNDAPPPRAPSPASRPARNRGR